MSNKNAYEIRLEILKEASSNLWSEYNLALDAARNTAIAAGDESGSYIKQVSVPTPESITAYADKLYKFVTQ